MRYLFPFFVILLSAFSLAPAFAQNSDRCARVRCAAPLCSQGKVKVGEKQVGCCRVAICQAQTKPCRYKAPCLYKGKAFPNGASFTAADGCNQCLCDNGLIRCTKKRCPNRCLHFYHKLCKTNADCRAGYRCSPPISGCQPSSCSCYPATSAKICTEDCRRNMGKCVR